MSWLHRNPSLSPRLPRVNSLADMHSASNGLKTTVTPNSPSSSADGGLPMLQLANTKSAENGASSSTPNSPRSSIDGGIGRTCSEGRLTSRVLVGDDERMEALRLSKMLRAMSNPNVASFKILLAKIEHDVQTLLEHFTCETILSRCLMLGLYYRTGQSGSIGSSSSSSSSSQDMVGFGTVYYDEEAYYLSTCDVNTLRFSNINFFELQKRGRLAMKVACMTHDRERISSNPTSSDIKYREIRESLPYAKQWMLDRYQEYDPALDAPLTLVPPTENGHEEPTTITSATPASKDMKEPRVVLTPRWHIRSPRNVTNTGENNTNSISPRNRGESSPATLVNRIGVRTNSSSSSSSFRSHNSNEQQSTPPVYEVAVTMPQQATNNTITTDDTDDEYTEPTPHRDRVFAETMVHDDANRMSAEFF